METWEFCICTSVVENTYFPAILFIDNQFEHGYHDRMEGFDFYNASLPIL